jgi:hypothetical protein
MHVRQVFEVPQARSDAEVPGNPGREGNTEEEGGQVKCFGAWLLLVISLSAQDREQRAPEERTDAPFRLFETKNHYTLLKLDTRTGQLWQVQWGLEDTNRYIVPVNMLVLGRRNSELAECGGSATDKFVHKLKWQKCIGRITDGSNQNTTAIERGGPRSGGGKRHRE